MDLKASLKNKDFWIFDLDNTLYPSSNGLMSDVSDRMTKFVSMVTDKSVEEALIEQKELFKNHGTTLRGLMIRYSIDPWDFLRFVHNVNYNLVEKNQKLGNAIKALKGKKIIYTNASATHAKKVLERLGFLEEFDSIFDVSDASWIPKPHIRSYQTLMEKIKFNPRSSVMIEDIAPNLRPASDIGITTVWIKQKNPEAPSWTLPEEKSDYIDYTIDDLTERLESLAPKQKKF